MLVARVDVDTTLVDPKVLHDEILNIIIAGRDTVSSLEW